MANARDPSAGFDTGVPGGAAIPAVRRTYILEAEIGWRTDAGPAVTLANAARMAIKWFDEKIPGHLTPTIYELGSDIVDQHGLQTLTTIGAIERGVWAGRLRYVDKPRKGQQAVAGRTWTAEVAFIADQNSVRVGIQMFMATRPGVDQTLCYDRPELVPLLESSFGLEDLTRLTARSPELSANALRSLVENSARRRSVVVLTKPDRPELGFTYLLDRTEFATQMLGIAWVVGLTPDESYAWTDYVGREWTVFGGAVRTYKPFLDWESDELYAHPLRLPDSISSWRFRGLEGESAFREFLVDQCAQDLCDPRITLSADLTFDKISETDIAARRSLAGYADLLPLAEEQILQQKLRIGDLIGQNEALALDLEASKEALDSERQAVQALLAQNDRYLQIIQSKAALEPPISTFPSEFAAIRDWCEQELSGRLQLLPRAARALKDAVYDDPKLVAGCLSALASEGRDWLSGTSGGKKRFDASCQELGVSCRKSITVTRAGEQDDAYYTEFPRGSGKRRLLEWHLCKGDDRDRRFCLRIYFFWDSESRSVVVGHLPDHLPIRSSN